MKVSAEFLTTLRHILDMISANASLIVPEWAIVALEKIARALGELNNNTNIPGTKSNAIDDYIC